MFDIINDPNFLPVTIIFVGLVLVAIWQKLDKFILPLSAVYIFYLIFMFVSLPSNDEQVSLHDLIDIQEDKTKDTVKSEKMNEPVFIHTDTTQIIEENVEEVENEATEDPHELRVNSFLMCESMIDSLRKPMNISDSFPISLKRVYCYSGIRNALSPREIMYEWYFQDQLIDIISIRIGRSVHWRSWTYKSISDSQIGEWYVILRDQITDTALDTTFFTITDE